MGYQPVLTRGETSRVDQFMRGETGEGYSIPKFAELGGQRGGEGVGSAGLRNYEAYQMIESQKPPQGGENKRRSPISWERRRGGRWADPRKRGFND